MSLGRVLVEKNLLDAEQLREASRRQVLAGGSLVENVLALGFIGADELERIIKEPPPAPELMEETGLDAQFLLNFLLKSIYVTGLETPVQASNYMKLLRSAIEPVFERAKKQRLLEVLGTSPTDSSVLRYTLSDLGRRWALEALQQSQYTGPAPVPLGDYRTQVIKQSIAHERITDTELTRHFSHLVLPPETLQRLGPAVNSGKAILLYGGVGNGKTSIAEAIGHTFKQSIYIPHCVEVEGQIFKLYDPAIHEPVSSDGNGAALGDDSVPDEPAFDPRWVLCQRPVVVTGGELTMELLDFSFDSVSKYYEAPAHIKAIGGVFIIDDFGRQRVRAADLLNRWILPLERGVDYLTLQTGMKLQLPFDELVIFSTNFPPEQLMDDAALRRVPYKLYIAAPTAERFAEIFHRVCEARSLELPDDVLSYTLNALSAKTPLGCFQPKLIVEHVIARCNYEGVSPTLTVERAQDAMQNLVIEGGQSSM
jgi:hypothetical protein